MPQKPWLFSRKKRKAKLNPAQDTSPLADEGKAIALPFRRSLEANLKILQAIFADCQDAVYRRMKIGGTQGLATVLIYIDGLVDNEIIDNQIVKSLLLEAPLTTLAFAPEGGIFNQVRDSLLTVANVREIADSREAVFCILSGFALLILEGSNKGLALEVCGWEHRGVEEPQNESLIRGPREGFSECFRTNTALLRRRLRDPQLKLKTSFLGRRSQTTVGVMYLDGIVNPGLLTEVEERLNKIDIDGILDSGFIEQLIEDNWYSPFAQIQSTERPDEATAALLEGRVVVLTDNTPFALLIPATFNSLMHSPEDFYHRWLISFLIRGLRFLGTALTLILPALYIAMISFSPEMIPTSLAISIGAGREGVPFPSIVEALIMEVVLELLREAGIRLPGPLGQTLGVVGALVLGQAAVQANIVSSAMVIVVALTAIGGFAAPRFDAAIALRILRFFLMIMATVLGLYGIILGLMLILTHLVSLKSFGVPYLQPWAPLRVPDLKDSIYRTALFNQRWRPFYLKPREAKKMGAGVKKK
ncbi:spore germination protein [Moorella sp. Hama-1]|uniref:spore germination protein n=1 Tax=Moorella sp. Hama-1 TaxID=2138101 RepID=UPI000D65D2EA|nr:spore germination protein [Moorella sp. Hama-1]MDN5361771.1 spore germination protein [Moorella sp. (in: firmicutes)]BCV21157.1 spore germination protein [Moorella sp. Hama-1]